MFKVSHQFSFRFSLFGQSDENGKISCPVYLLFTEKVNFLLVNKEKISQLKLTKTNKTADFFVFRHFDQIMKNELMRYSRHKKQNLS